MIKDRVKSAVKKSEIDLYLSLYPEKMSYFIDACDKDFCDNYMKKTKNIRFFENNV